MKIFLCLIALTVLVFATPADVNVSGKWTGTLTVAGPDGANDESPAFLVLKQEGAAVTGSAGPHEGEQYPITKGSVAGDKLTIEIEPKENQSLKLELVLTNDRMKGDVTMFKNGETRNAKIEVARAK